MSEQPAVRPITTEVYEALPEVYRREDPPTGYALLRYLSLALDPLSRVGELADAFDPDDGSLPQLLDGARADEAWLPWLAQLLGLGSDGATVEELRRRTADPELSWQHGSTGLLRQLIRDQVGPDAEVVVTAQWAPPGFGNTDARFEEPGATFDDLGGTLRPGQEEPWTIAVWTSDTGDALTFAELWEGLSQSGRTGPVRTWSDLGAVALRGVTDAEVPAGWRLVVTGRRPRTEDAPAGMMSA